MFEFGSKVFQFKDDIFSQNRSCISGSCCEAQQCLCFDPWSYLTVLCFLLCLLLHMALLTSRLHMVTIICTTRKTTRQTSQANLWLEACISSNPLCIDYITQKPQTNPLIKVNKQNNMFCRMLYNSTSSSSSTNH